MNIASVRRPIVPPAPPRAPDNMSFLGKLAVIRRNMIATWGQRAYEEEVIPGRFVFRNSFILNRPDAIRHVLLTNYENYTRTPAGIRMLRPVLGEGLLIAEGHSWTFQRRTLAPAFTPRATANLVPHMTAVLDETIAKLDARASELVDLREIMQRMTLEIAGRTMFSFGMDQHGATLRNFVMEYGERLGRPYFLDMVLPVSWPTPMDRARARFRKRWTDFVSMLIAERRKMGKKDGAPPRDLFDLMDEARDPETGKGFSDEQLIDEVATMILAGHETTATALFWALYLLALDPETQEEVASETQGEHLDSMADIDRQKFTRAVIEETMRLYPPAFLVARAAREKDNAAGVEIGKGDIIMIAPWLLHRHEKLWDQPNAFIPKRFMSTEAPDRFAYLPFGAGPRVCIGAPFAQAESVLALARLIGAFRVELADQTPVIPHGVVTTQPGHSPMFRITRR
ncbi:cytochrome P450 [Bradyrhizobium huanghuaihaiense]|uniref:Cytochrome P450 n=1 Tax=Bradyrhizobium huanghuaihaiense TaxID=990078 RepID=A0A562S4V0_9BRAD|nr:cytochrome P450 [Bradyrhizobium huanghuaihaiense]TWI76299.1 cytochrome P450 [Bradyrhizobium huanghuaihaiense]